MKTKLGSRSVVPLILSSLCVSTIFAQHAVPDRSSHATQPSAMEKGLQAAPASPEEIEREMKLRAAIEKGATMEEVAALKDPVAKTPEEAVHALKAGNSRFFGGHARRPELSANERRAQILGQSPFAVVLGCSDSRVPTELVYDQGLGDIFTVRVAGQIVDRGTAGSIEYAVAHLKTKVLVVMGHEGCGAVKAAMLDEAEIKSEPENVQFLLNEIAPAVKGIPAIRDAKAKMREAVIANVRRQVAKVKENPVVKASLQKNEIAVIGAYYEISSGQVDFLETDEELR